MFVCTERNTFSYPLHLRLRGGGGVRILHLAFRHPSFISPSFICFFHHLSAISPDQSQWPYGSQTQPPSPVLHPHLPTSSHIRTTTPVSQQPASRSQARDAASDTRMTRQTFSGSAIQELDDVMMPRVSSGQSTGMLDFNGSALGILGLEFNFSINNANVFSSQFILLPQTKMKVTTLLVGQHMKVQNK